MAISRVKNSVALQMVNNYGEVEGKLVKKTKSYNYVRTNAPDDAIYAVYEAIDALQEADAENCFVVAKDELISE